MFLSDACVLRSKPDEIETDATNGSLAPEVQLVNEITAEGGIRSAPSRETLKQFTKRSLHPTA